MVNEYNFLRPAVTWGRWTENKPTFQELFASLGKFHWRASVYFYTVCMFLLTKINIITTDQKLCAPIHFDFSWSSSTCPISYFKATLKSNDNKASPCFRTFLKGNISNKCSPIWTFLQPLPALCNSYIAEYPLQVEFWARHNSVYIW